MTIFHTVIASEIKKMKVADYKDLLDKDGKTATRKPIRTGRQNPEMFEILQGLKPGDRVVTSSYSTYGKIQRLNLN